MGAVVAGAGKVRGRCLYIRTILCCGGKISPYVWVGDVGYVPTHWEDSGQLPPQCGPQIDGEVSKEEDIWEMGLPPTGGGNGGGGHEGGVDQLQPLP